ncbi:peptidoglycan metallopeptidase [Bacillus phage YungSlug]|nr:peptidoglycan metallopeptidase [Bacillus phage YungSlug]
MKDGFVKVSFKLNEDGNPLINPFDVFNQPAIEVGSPVGTITSKFGSMESFRTHSHTGIDYACPDGTPLYAPYDGVVTSVRDYGGESLGKAVFVKMEDGKQYTLGHLSNVDVKVGDKVSHGDLLAHSGNTGHSTGSHLHFGMFDSKGQTIDPGNIDFNSFQPITSAPPTPDMTDGISELLKGHNQPDVFTHADKVKDLHDRWNDLGGFMSEDTIAHHGFKWVGKYIFEPLGIAIKEGAHDILVATMHSLPLVLTCGGLVCFLLTIAIGNHKPYFYGLACWAGSAIMRVISHEMGI